MSNQQTVLDIDDSQPLEWIDTQLDTQSLAQSYDYEELPASNTQAATISYDDQPSQKRARMESPMASAIDNPPLLPAALTLSAITPASRPQHAEPMKFRGTMPLTCNLTTIN